MDNHTSPGRIGQTAQDLKEYAALRVDSFRLSLIDNLSSFFNSLFGVFILIVLLGIATTFFAIALTWVLGIADAAGDRADGLPVRRIRDHRLRTAPKTHHQPDGQDAQRYGA